MQEGDAFILRGIEFFIRDFLVGGGCYLAATLAACRVSAVPWRAYLARLVLMSLVVLLWWGLFMPLHRSSSQPYYRAETLGGMYGLYTIWAWCAAALVSMPRRSPKSLQATATALVS